MFWGDGHGLSPLPILRNDVLQGFGSLYELGVNFWAAINRKLPDISMGHNIKYYCRDMIIHGLLQTRQTLQR
jgi:hypothetical protein